MIPSLQRRAVLAHGEVDWVEFPEGRRKSRPPGASIASHSTGDPTSAEFSHRSVSRKGRYVQWGTVPPEDESGTFVAWVASVEETKRMPENTRPSRPPSLTD